MFGNKQPAATFQIAAPPNQAGAWFKRLAGTGAAGALLWVVSCSGHDVVEGVVTDTEFVPRVTRVQMVPVTKVECEPKTRTETYSVRVNGKSQVRTRQVKFTECQKVETGRVEERVKVVSEAKWRFQLDDGKWFCATELQWNMDGGDEGTHVKVKPIGEGRSC